MSHDPAEEARKAAAANQPLPGNYGRETFREYCGLSRRRKLGKRHFEDPGVSAQDLFRAIGRHAK